MKNKKNVLIISLIFCFCIFIVLSLSIYIGQSIKTENSKFKYIKIYYYDKANDNLEFEEKKMNIQNDNFIEEIFSEMKALPKSANLRPIVPQSLQIIDFKLEKDILTINFSNVYDKLSDSEKIILRAGIVWTMTQIPSIKNIYFLVEDKELIGSDNTPIGYLNRNNVILNPIILPDKIEKEKIVLYFANKQKFLEEEDRNIEAKQNKSLEKQILEELIKGPSVDTHIKTIPTETKIRNIKTEDKICYLDLSSEFIEKRDLNAEIDILCIYSIVNSLTELNTVNKVQFLIDGEKINNYGNIDISKPLGRNISIIKK